MFEIRPYHPTDLPSLYRICLQTSDNGGDGTALFDDPELIGHFYAGPYAVLEPDLCFVLTQHAVPIGYVLGTRDSAEFATRCEQAWFPPLRQRYPLPSASTRPMEIQVTHLLHQGHDAESELADYPAHLHIDILPAGQGKGFGRKLLTTFFNALRTKQVAGVHLWVATSNPNAVGFYRNIGFTELQSSPSAIAFGMRL